MLSDDELDQIEDDVQQDTATLREIWADLDDSPFTDDMEEDDKRARIDWAEKHIASSRGSSGSTH